jgi:sulfate adenylyltransferase subunit 1
LVRLLVDSKTVLRDCWRYSAGQTDLVLLTDFTGLSVVSIIDVAYRCFNTAARRFIIADAPDREQCTRNMVTASSADAPVVLVDAANWTGSRFASCCQNPSPSKLLFNLVRASIVFSSKLDAVADRPRAFSSHQRRRQSPLRQLRTFEVEQSTAVIRQSASTLDSSRLV